MTYKIHCLNHKFINALHKSNHFCRYCPVTSIVALCVCIWSLSNLKFNFHRSLKSFAGTHHVSHGGKKQISFHNMFTVSRMVCGILQAKLFMTFIRQSISLCQSSIKGRLLECMTLQLFYRFSYLQLPQSYRDSIVYSQKM